MAELISERRQSGALGNDMLSSLMDASDEAGGKLSADELIGHAGVIFAAGHETSSNALCWTLFLLSQHPKVAADLADELAGELRGDAPTVEQLARLPLLDHVVKESLRVFPPVPFNHRLAAGDTELGGYTLRSGTEIISSIYHTHRIEEIYPDAQRFKPERWEQLDPGPYAYSPFSAGPRMCIGAAFAMMEIKVVLAVLLQRFRFEIVPGSRVDRFMSITMAPKHGLPMVVHRQDNRFERRAPEVRGNVREMVTLGA
jgi:cytochrome P450